MELKMIIVRVKFATPLSKTLHLTYLWEHIWKAKQTSILCQWVNFKIPFRWNKCHYYLTNLEMPNKCQMKLPKNLQSEWCPFEKRFCLCPIRVSVATVLAWYSTCFFMLSLWGFAMIISGMNFDHCLKVLQQMNLNTLAGLKTNKPMYIP